MHSSHQHFIQTKEAAKLFSYSTDYIARLARSGDILGERRGRAWFIDPDSLTNYLRTQSDRKVLRGEALAHERVQEYRGVRPAKPSSRRARQPIAIAIPVYTEPVFVHERRSYLPEAFAFAIACAVVGSGALLARSPAIPALASHLASSIEQIDLGFSVLTAHVPTELSAHLASGGKEAQLAAHRATERVAAATGYIVSPDLAYTRFSLNIPVAAPMQSREEAGDAVVAIRTELPSFAAISSPQATLAVLASIYIAIGQHGYQGVTWTLDAYPRLLTSAGSRLLVLGAATRDVLGALPEIAMKGDAALGQMVVDATHGAIAIDVAFAYAAAGVPNAMDTIASSLTTHLAPTVASVIKAVGR